MTDQIERASSRTASEPPAPGSGTSGPRRAPFVLLVVTLLGAGLCALLALNTATAASEVRERRLDASNGTLTDSEQQLSREIASMQAPQNLASQASKLGLVPADSPAFIKINPNGSVTILGKPAQVEVPVQVIPKTDAQIAAEKKAAEKKAAEKKAAEKRSGQGAGKATTGTKANHSTSPVTKHVKPKIKTRAPSGAGANTTVLPGGAR